MISDNNQQAAPAAGVWTELQQHRRKAVAKDIALLCCVVPALHLTTTAAVS